MKRIVVVGAGAIGASIGALLFETGIECVLVARGEHGRALADNGVALRFPQTSRVVRVPTVSTVREAAPTKDDLVLLATMGHHTQAALAELTPDITVASFQNGLAPLETIGRRGHPTLAAMVNVPAERRGPGVIALAGVPDIGAVLVGAWPSGGHPWAPLLVERLSRGGLRAEVEEDIAPWIRAKLLVNLAGIVVALSDEPAMDVIEAAREEARTVWRARGEAFLEPSAIDARFGERGLALVDGKPRLGGSTRHALARGQPLETACLHGDVRGKGIATPVNDALVHAAERATRERRVPGSVTPDDLRRLVRVT